MRLERDKNFSLMNGAPGPRWTLTLAALVVGALPGFWLGRALVPGRKAAPPPHPVVAAPGETPRQAECLATLPLQIMSVAVDEPGAPRREGPGLQVVDGQQLRVSARGAREDNQGLVFAFDTEGLAHPLWPNSGISAPCPGGCTTLQVAIPASTLPVGSSRIAVYVGFGRFELPAIQDGLRNQGPTALEAKDLPMVRGARAAASQLIVHAAKTPSL